ncbi:ankyrin repeat domain-containing protein [Sphingobacterium spiritivorum]|uniref:ankyrin repeat domain-containing protein n=1 Tax=Sphingobacterium spiritivorum TaxID=258 RepID=UPI003DA5548C
MKNLFKAIRNRNIDEVSGIIDKNPILINAVAKGISEKDDGEIPLQTAIKTDNYEIAELLIKRGANIKFGETESENQEWRKPVLHFAVSAVIHNSRFAIYIPKYSSQNKSGFLGLFKKDQWKIKPEPTVNYRKAIELLQLIITQGADVNATDSYGVGTVEVLCNEIENVQLDRSKPLTQESINDLYPVFELIKATKISDFNIPSKRGNTIYDNYKHTIDQIILNKK